MKILIDEREIYVADEMVDQVADSLWKVFEETYQDLDETIRFGMKLFIRETIKKLEKQYGMQLRPPKGDDPVMHLMGLMLNFGTEVIKRHASLEVTTVSDGNTDAASVSVAIAGEGEGWRQVVSRRDYGLRENNFLEEITSASHEVVS